MLNNINKTWKEALSVEFEQKYFKQLLLETKTDYLLDHTIHPPAALVFNVFETCSLNKVRVVILGQDPYHGPGQAMGLAFSVPEDVKIPPSLLNIFKEIENDIGTNLPTSGDLTRWAEQGVFLLNTTLTVATGQPGSHQNRGWEKFTDSVIEKINTKREDVVFMLWGAHAGKKSELIDQTKHLVLKAPHPSPLSAYRGFFGCKHFSQCNEYLTKKNQEQINW